jgi:hypothetical protein
MTAIVTAARLALIPLVGILWFFGHSKATVGSWFVTAAFYVARPDVRRQAREAVARRGVVGIRQLGSETLARVGFLSAVGSRCCGS